MTSDGQRETLRRILRGRVPPYSDNKLIHDLCEDIIQTFGLLYPDQTLNLCMRLAQRLSTEDFKRNVLEKRGPTRAKQPSVRRIHPSRQDE